MNSRLSIALIVFVLALLPSAPAATGCLPPPGGIVAWWPASGDAVDVIGGNNGTLMNSAGFGVGEVGTAFSFSRLTQDYVEVPDSGLWAFGTNDFSIEMWVSFGTLPSSGSPDVLISNDEGNYNVNKWFLAYSGGYIVFHVNSPERGEAYPVTAAFEPNAGQWYHIALTRSGDQFSLYIDGALAATNSQAVLVPDANAPLMIGQGEGYYFDGLIDEVAIYNRSLAAGEIGAIYAAGTAGKCASPAPPVIVTQPVGGTIAAGETFTLNVQSLGFSTPQYQWNLNGSPISGASMSSYTITSATTNDAGTYTVDVTDGYGSATSSNALLQVLNLVTSLADAFDPAIDGSQWSAFGSTVLATNYGGAVSAPNSLWFGGSGSRYATTRAIDTRTGGRVRFHLRLASGPAYPWETVELPGKCVVLECSTNLGSSWSEIGRFDTAQYYAWTNRVLQIPSSAQSIQCQFRWRQIYNSGANSDHWALDNVIISTFESAPAIVRQPQGQSAYYGGAASFTVDATGNPAPSYQWRFNGAAIPGATASALSLFSLQAAQAGTYSVVASNRSGAAISSNAVLVLQPAPACTAISNAIAWWSAEDGAVDTLGTHNGTLLGGAATGAGLVGNGFLLNGTSAYVQAADSPDWAFGTNAFTIELWASISNLTGLRALVANNEGSGQTRKWLFSLNNGVLQFHINSSQGAVFLGSTVVNRTADEWHHLGVSRSGANFTFYMDGIPVETNTSSATVPDAAAPLTIGSTEGTYFFSGRLDEVSIYNRALTAAEMASIYAANLSGKCRVSPSVLSHPANLTVNTYSNATLAVVAAGSPPLRYQWRFNGGSIAGATNSSLVLTNVQMVQAGSYSALVSNAWGSALSSNAVLSVLPPPASVQIGSVSNVAAWDTVVVPVLITANGNENSLTFSVHFDPSQLTYAGSALGAGAPGAFLLVNTAQLPSGNLGISLALPDGVSFQAGTQEAAKISFSAGIFTNAGPAAIVFTNSPVARRLADSADVTLPATYANGSVYVLPAEYEGDVSPRGAGNRSVTISDWALVGRFAARLDYPTNSVEFQRADCAPRATRGDGAIRVSDWVQVGRYISPGLDPATPVGGPTGEIVSTGAGPSSSRLLTVSQPSVLPGQPVAVSVTLNAQGDENAAGFSLSFNPAQVSFVSAVPGLGAPGASINVNTAQAASGRIGIALALNPGSVVPAGAREIVRLNFTGSPTASGILAPTFSDAPVPREIASDAAAPLPVSFVAGTVTNYPGPLLRIDAAGQNAVLSWTPWATNFVLQQTANSLAPNSIWSNVPVAPNQNSFVVPITRTNRFYRLVGP